MKDIIKKILREEFDNSEMDWINEINPSEAEIWLHKNFSHLKPIIKGDKTIYLDEEDKPVFYFRQGQKNGYCYFKHSGFWAVFMYQYDMKYSEIQELLKRWLDVTYNLRGLTPQNQVPFP